MVRFSGFYFIYLFISLCFLLICELGINVRTLNFKIYLKTLYINEKIDSISYIQQLSFKINEGECS